MYCSERDGSDETPAVTRLFQYRLPQEWMRISMKSLQTGLCDAWRPKHRPRYSSYEPLTMVPALTGTDRKRFFGRPRLTALE
jgi:hypothetical protein